MEVNVLDGAVITGNVGEMIQTVPSELLRQKRQINYMNLSKMLAKVSVLSDTDKVDEKVLEDSAI